MVRDITLHSDVEQGSPDRANREARHSASTAQPASPRYSTPCRDLGTTKVNRRGDLGSDSDVGSPDPTPRAVSILLSPEKRSPGGPSLEKWSPDEWTCERRPFQQRTAYFRTGSPPERFATRSIQIRNRLPPGDRVGHADQRMTESISAGKPMGELRNHLDDANMTRSGGQHSVDDKSDPYGEGPSAHARCDSVMSPPENTPEHPKEIARMTEDDVASWQQEIQLNYQKSLEDKENTTMMQAEVWSDVE